MQSLAPCLLLAALTLALAGCGEEPATMDDFTTRVVTLPNGKGIRAEVMMRPEDMMRGMMFRDSLAPDRGMLFIHGAPGRYPYWMYQVKIPLDILWLSGDRRIVEISADTPPCSTRASECTHYGGNADALFVLELAGGMAAKHGLQVGDRLSF
jgi:uncharacterized membrane protein (UPF0127 family)